MRSYRYWLGLFILLFLLYAPIGVLNPYWLSLNHLPTGGDTASHVFYAYQFCQYFPQHGLTQWLPEVFGGLPFLSYYFPLPFIVIFLLNQWLPFALAFKWAVFAAAIVMPASVYLLSLFCFGFSRIAGLFASIATLAFLLHEQNSIWGGNLLSILAGEFAYSYGMLFSLLTLAVWIKALQGRYFWVLGGLLEAATGFSHGYALLITGFSSLFLLFCGNFKVTLRFLTLTHTLAFCLLAGWLWPLLEMHGLTIPNDGAFMANDWHDFLPKTLWPVLLTGLVGGIFYCFPAIRKQWPSSAQQALAFMLSATMLAVTFWFSANRIGLADIRFFPYVWLFAALVCGWLFGEALKIGLSSLTGCYALPIRHGVVLLMGVWLYQAVSLTPQWSAWNHSGYEEKANWQKLSVLFPVLSGRLDSPRLLFEHAPVNNDLGSTRALETLPMFLNQRPVLEGLYMESALLAPVIYHLQSEVSKAPSSPLVRFPSASLDISSAIPHMNLLHANEVLVRSDEAKTDFDKSPLFQKLAESSPFTVYRLKNFDSQLIQALPLPAQIIDKKNWMEHAFNWFKHYPKVDYWPVYSEDQRAFKTSKAATVKLLNFERERIVFTTDQPGAAHLVKIAFHPRWQLTGKGKIYLAAPGYMVVVPENNRVELVYGTTLIGRWGQIASIFAVCVILGYLLLQIRRTTQPRKLSLPSATGKALLIWLVVLAGINLYAYQNNPERYYRSGWQAMNRQDYQAAAIDFDRIEGRRSSPAAQEEALFWAAKAHELAGDRPVAKQRYQKLIGHYSGYWLPESLYTLARLQRLDSQPEAALALEQRLRNDYPQHSFTRALDQQ
ncbi:MAG: hypothetical protein PHR16_05885 [Methylovulum sp.]|nr:hypothetical protein [Methylovulum sp.]